MSLRQLLVDFGDQSYYRKLEEELKGMSSVLDLGCGSNSPLAKVKKTFFSVGVDMFKPSIQGSQKAKIHNRYKIGDVLEIDKFFKRKSFDAVLALDLIEHLKKKDGFRLLKKMEAIAKQKIIILTPNGFVKQDPTEDNPYQSHRSGWENDEFKERGYRVYGMRGLKCLRGEYATLKFKPWVFWGLFPLFLNFYFIIFLNLPINYSL